MELNDKVSAAKLGGLCKFYNCHEAVQITAGDGESEVKITVKCRLKPEEMVKIVSDVCDGVFDSKTGAYHPELKDYYLRVAVLETYTNLTLPKGKASWNLVYGTPIFAMVTGYERRPVFFNGFEYDDNLVIDVEQYEQIVTAIDQKIEYILRQNALNEIIRTHELSSGSCRGLL